MHPDHRQREHGQAAAEFALALPILCLLLLGVIAFGQLIWASIDLTSATRDGARRAVVARADTTVQPTTQVRDVVRNSLDRVDPDDVTISTTGIWEKDRQITVRTSAPYRLSIMGVVVWNGPLTAESKVRIG